MANNLTKSVVFITGTFLGNNCWDEWQTYFEAKGYRCIAPAWPYKNASPEELRNGHPDSAIALNRLGGLTDYFAEIVNALPEKPIMIGHSLGGLIVQLLLQRECAAAGVAIHSFPPGGLRASNISFIKCLWRALGLFTSTKKTYMISFKKWKNAVTNGMTCEEQKKSFYEYATPESKLIIRDTFKAVAKIHFEKKHAPLLFISGSGDKIISASLNFDNYKNYKVSNSITDYRDFKSRNHLVLGHSAWKEEADFILHWLQGIK
ncbi:MAG TPA: alpha/beta hydrolase [Cyclobacteriaceae bacterium]